MPTLEEQLVQDKARAFWSLHSLLWTLLMGPETAGPEIKGGWSFALLPSKDCYTLVRANPLAHSPPLISGREAQATPWSSV